MIEQGTGSACSKCHKCMSCKMASEFIREPILLWDRFPCPPPGTDRSKLIVELDWTGRMGTQDGCRAFDRVAKRCNVEFTQATLPDSLTNCDNFVYGYCGTQCVIAIILACILVCFIFILVLVCCRYVRSRDKSPSDGVCTKVVSPGHDVINTHLNRSYLQSPYYYTAGNIPHRRGLPIEVRTTENGVEARLIKAIQAAPMQGFDDVCSQCRSSISRHSTLSSQRSRQGIDRYDGSQRRVPSSESLMYRRQSDRHRSLAGSSSDASHHYEYIGDHICPGMINNDPYSGRRSNQSTLYFPKPSSFNSDEMQCLRGGDDIRYTDDDRMLMLSRFINTDKDNRNEMNQDIVPYFDSDVWRDKHNSCNSLMKVNKFQIADNAKNTLPEKYRRPPKVREDRHVNPCSYSPAKNPVENLTSDPMTGYKYTFNPNYDEETTSCTKSSKSDYIEDVNSTPNSLSDS